jgi:hypothetical protein
VIGPGIRSAAVRAGLVAGGFTLAAVAVGRIPVPGLVRALGMLALPCLLVAVLRREERRLGEAALRARGPARPRAPEAPARRTP